MVNKSKLSPPFSLLNSKIDFANNETIEGNSCVIPGEPRGALHMQGIAASSVRFIVVKVCVAIFYWCSVQPIEVIGTKQIVGPNPSVTW